MDCIILIISFILFSLIVYVNLSELVIFIYSISFVSFVLSFPSTPICSNPTIIICFSEEDVNVYINLRNLSIDF